MKKTFVDENGKEYVAKIKKPFYKKIWFWVLIVVLIAAIGSQMGDDAEPTAKQTAATTTTNTTEKKEEAKQKADKKVSVGDTIEFDKFSIKIDGISLVKDYKDKDTIKIVYTYTNKSEESQSPYVQVNFKGFQNGVELTEFFMSESIDLGVAQKEIKAGVVLENCQTGITLDDMSKVEIEIDELITFSSEPYILVVDPNNL